MIVDTWYRHLIKTGTWRVIAFLFLGVTSYLVTGSLTIAMSIAAVDWIVKSIMYFLHEWAWSKSKLGKKITKKKGCVVWFTGLSGSGKTTVADKIAEKLRERLIPTSRLDGDVARRTFSSDLGFSSEDRSENCKRATLVASFLKETQIVLASFISPTHEIRDYVRKMCGKDLIMVHVHCPIKVCAERDPKGMYAQIVDGKFKGNPFTGMHPDAPYWSPGKASVDVILETDEVSLDVCADKIIKRLEKDGYL